MSAVPYTKQKEALLSGTADVFGGYVTPVSSDIWNFDITPSYYNDSINFICPVAPQVSIWIRLSSIFPCNFWVKLCSLMIVSALIGKLFYKLPFVKSVLEVLAILTENNISSTGFHIGFVRILHVSWLFFAIIAMTGFKSYLSLIMETVDFAKPLDTLDDIINSGLPIHSMIDLRPYYGIPEEKRKLNLSDVKPCTSFIECHKKVSEYQNLVSVGGYGLLKYYYIPRFYMKNDESTVHISSEAVYSFRFHLLFRKGHPQFEPCSKIILLSMSNGWFAKKFSDMKHLLYLKTSGKPRIRSKIITLSELNYVFVMWIIGLIISISVFVCEQTLSLFSKR